ncbi:TetR/AcrR family transcriptional regulator [Stigmatella erecta]|uniref:Transcriptional regulator, TetR family n=1 Tax=Stigmatella erecta TaxID=83460 RepID=A0A1I0KGD0_9BACT|nr:TetR/AcrR family transcriptional regulator [Stigmatella erecta]SEU22882.1 transcriptional regulator, TetR family [Stigmatella erecta]
MADASGEARDALRRKAILEAARGCFLQFGYAKTSLDDIAQRANISRTLIYRKFKNKDDIFSALLDFMFEERYPKADAVLAGPGGKRDKLLQVYELLVVEPWGELAGTPMVAEFYEACSRLFPEVDSKHERLRLKYTQAVLEPKEIAELFMLAVDGLLADLPPVRTLRRRLQLLAERFVP